MEAIARNWAAVCERVARAAARADRDVSQIDIVAVSKHRSANQIDAALQAGVRHLGENRIQEAETKRPEVAGEAVWHLVGHLQRNKVGKAIELFDLVQSVDSPRLADALERRAAEASRIVNVLVQVNSAGAGQQSGAAPETTLDLVRHIADLPHVQARGLMTIGAFTEEADQIRACFRLVSGLARQVVDAGIAAEQMQYLSMGMSGDFELAIEEGANLLRIGTAIFGPRGQ